jgi:hypothetical protein
MKKPAGKGGLAGNDEDLADRAVDFCPRGEIIHAEDAMSSLPKVICLGVAILFAGALGYMTLAMRNPGKPCASVAAGSVAHVLNCR